MTTERNGSGAPTREERFKACAAEFCKDAGEIFKLVAEEAERFVRERPVAGAVTAFVAGWVLSSLFRR